MNNRLVRKNILKIKAYQPGKPIEEVKRELGLREVIKLASNENPLGSSPKALEAIRRNLSNINRYPDSQSFYLKKRIASSIGVKSTNLVLGNGSDELISIIIGTFVERGENVLTSNVTFLEYEIIAQVHDRRVIKVPLKGFKYDIDAIKKKITAKTKLIFIANPNNPTGTYVTKIEIEGLLSAMPKNTILALDEAYDAFIDVKDFPDSLKYINTKNVIVMKTLSKAYGLAGLRIGYAVAGDTLAAAMERARQPFNVNLLAQAAALAAFDDKNFLRRTREVTLKGKAYLYEELGKLGVSYVPSVSNFILIAVERDCVDIFRKLLKLGVIVRDMKQYGLDNFIRVTIGTENENRKFIQALRRVL